MEGFSVRLAVPEDLPAILEIEKKVHLAPWTPEHFKNELDKPYSRTWVLTDDETDQTVAAYLVFWSMEAAWEVLNVAVDLPFRGLGLAKDLVRRVAAEAIRSGAKQVVLDVRKTNIPALHLYQKLGFTVRQVRKAAYSNGEDGYFMALSVEEDGLRF